MMLIWDSSSYLDGVRLKRSDSPTLMFTSSDNDENTISVDALEKTLLEQNKPVKIVTEIDIPIHAISYARRKQIVAFESSVNYSKEDAKRLVESIDAIDLSLKVREDCCLYDLFPNGFGNIVRLALSRPKDHLVDLQQLNRSSLRGLSLGQVAEDGFWESLRIGDSLNRVHIPEECSVKTILALLKNNPNTVVYRSRYERIDIHEIQDLLKAKASKKIIQAIWYMIGLPPVPTKIENCYESISISYCKDERYVDVMRILFDSVEKIDNLYLGGDAAFVFFNDPVLLNHLSRFSERGTQFYLGNIKMTFDMLIEWLSSLGLTCIQVES
jgi:hypothetical protein